MTFENDRIIRMAEVSRILGVSEVTLFRWRREGLFLEPIRLGTRMIGWRLSEVDKWIEERRGNVVKIK